MARKQKRKLNWKVILSILAAFFIIGILVPDENSDVPEVNEPQTELAAKGEKESKNKETKQSTEGQVTEEQSNSEEEAQSETNKDKSKPDETTKDEKGDVPVVSAPEKKQTDSVNKNQVPVQFVRVVDGDTAVVIYNGKEETVRYLLIDTPESKSPNTCVQLYGKDASARNEQLLKSGKVTLEFDGPKRDKYGRLLAYVFVNGVSVQKTLLEEGYARVAYIYDPPYVYLDEFRAAETRAKNGKKRIWSISGYVTDNGFSKCETGGSSNKSNNNSSSSGGGSSSSSGGGNSSNGGNNSSTGGNNTTTPPQSGEKENFKNCTELRKVYPDGVPSGHPAYQSKMDRDKDGWACER